MKHQSMICDFAAPKPYAGIFAEYGTGKTLAALMIVEKIRLRRVLVVSTKLSVQSTWPSEIKQHTDYKWAVLVGERRKKAKILYYAMKMFQDATKYHKAPTTPLICLVNYDGIKNIYRELSAVPWDAIILDESTKIKSPDTLRTRILWDLGKRIPRRYIMTGFPVTEAITNIYSQIKFLSDENLLGSSYYAFLNMYFVRMGTKVLPRKKQITKLFEKIAPFCLHVTNKSLKLPPKIYKKVDVPLTEKQKELLSSFRKTFQLEFGKVKIDTQYIFVLITKSLQICDGYVKGEDGAVAAVPTNKDEFLIEELDAVNASRNKVVIWARFRYSLNKIRRILIRLGLNVLVLNDKTEDPDRIVKHFQHDKKYTILLASQKKAAESITLTSSRYGMYYSNEHSFDLRGNSEARIRRKGSEGHSSIVYTDFVCESPVEQRVYDCLRQKRDLVGELKKYFLSMEG